MKKTFLLIAFAVLLTGCEKAHFAPGNDDLLREQADPDVLFKIGRIGEEFRFNDIELYDSSAHILYFKEAHRELTDLMNALNDPFYFLDNGHTIYSGSFVPAYSSSIPSGPFIQSPSMYGDYALWIDYWYGSDLRNHPGLIEVLKDHNLLHSGISGNIDQIEINASRIDFTFTITNYDMTDLMILDINKTGPNLFHYFTNGLYLLDKNNHEVFSSAIPHEKPEPWNSWKPEWLTVIKSGESISFTIDYQVIKPINPGEYNISFQFPGMAYQVSKGELFQGDARIWLGEINLKGRITIK